MYMTMRLLTAGCIVLGILSEPVVAEWTSAGGPFGGDVRSFTRQGITIFAGTNDGGVFASADGGESWSGSSVGLTFSRLSAMRVFALTSVGGTLVAGTLGGGVFRSTDSGATWIAADSGINNHTIYSFTVKGDTVFAGDYNGNIYQSVNLAKKWTVVESGLTIKPVYAMTSSHDTVYALVYGEGVLRSDNSGKTWIWKKDSLSNFYLQSLLVRGNTLLAGAANYLSAPGALFRSADCGEQWKRVTIGTDTVDVRALAADDSLLYVATGTCIFTSADDGVSWVVADSALAQNGVNTLFAANGSLYAGTLHGIFVSTDHGSSWKDANNGLTATTLRATAFAHDKVLAGVYGGVAYLDPASATWKPLGKGVVGGGDVWSITSLGNRYFAAAQGIFSLENDTALWHHSLTYDVRCGPVIGWGDTLYAAVGNQGIYFSPDSGGHWIDANWGFGYFAVIESTLFIGSFGQSEFRSESRNGVTWVKIANKGGPPNCNALIALNDDLYAGSGSGVFRSGDMGATWVSVNEGLRDSSVMSFAARGNRLYVATRSGVYATVNRGDTWVDVGSGLADNLVLSLTAGNDTLFAGTYGAGVWKRALSEMVVAATVPPAASRLLSNRIVKWVQGRSNLEVHFSCDNSDKAVLTLFSVSGKKVASCEKQGITAGAQIIAVNTRDVSAGCYYAVLQSGKNRYFTTVSLVR